MSDQIEFGQLVQLLIDALTMTQAELAERLRVSPGTLYSWSTGRRQPNPENGLRLAEVADRHAEQIAERAAQLRRAILEAR